MQRAERLVILWGAVVLSLIGILTGPYLIFRLADDLGMFLCSCIAGMLVALVGLLAIWCVLINQAAIVRLPLTFCLFLTGGGLFLWGIRLANQLPSVEEAALWSFLMVLLFLGMQLPLWMVRLLLRCRIALQSETKNRDGMNQFSIRYLLSSTAVAALIVGLFRMAVPTGDISSLLFLSGAVLLNMVVFTVFSVSVCLPCLWLILSERQSRHGAAAITLFLLWVGGPFFILMLDAVFLTGTIPASEFLPPLYCFGLGAILLMVLGLGLLRMLGYRLMIVDPLGKLQVENDLHPAGPSTQMASLGSRPKEPPTPPC